MFLIVGKGPERALAGVARVMPPELKTRPAAPAIPVPAHRGDDTGPRRERNLMMRPSGVLSGGMEVRGVWIYCALFILNLIGVMLVWRVSVLLDEEYESIAISNSVWSAASERTRQLNKSVRRANAPVNNVFSSLEVDAESRRFQEAASGVFVLLAAEREALRNLTSASVRDRLLANVDDAERHFKEMSKDAEWVFRHLAAGRKKNADARMAAADREYGEFHDAMDNRHAIIAGQQSEIFLNDDRYRRGLSSLVTFSIALLGALSGVFAFLGARLAIAARAAALSAIQSETALRESETNLKALNRNLEDMVSAQKQFVSDAAHQLRTPLAGIKLQTERALEAKSTDEGHLALEQVRMASERASQLLIQLLILASADPKAGLRHGFEKVDLVNISQEVGLGWIPPAHAKGIEIELVCGDEPVPVFGNRILLEQMFSNLVDNAIRHTPDSGRIILSVRRDPEPCFRIEDSGPGIAVDERQRVFERFYRGSGAVGQGSGLGLAIVRDVATLHKATVVLGQSHALRGLSASISFPRNG